MTARRGVCGDVVRVAAQTCRHLAALTASAGTGFGTPAPVVPDHADPSIFVTTSQKEPLVNHLVFEQLARDAEREAHTQARQARLARLARDRGRTSRATRAARTTRRLMPAWR